MRDKVGKQGKRSDMARKTKAQKAEDKRLRMAGELVDWYDKSMKKMQPASKPGDIRAVVEAGIRMIGFLDADKRIAPPADTPKAVAADGDAVKDAFRALQVMSDDKPIDTPPE